MLYSKCHIMKLYLVKLYINYIYIINVLQMYFQGFLKNFLSSTVVIVLRALAIQKKTVNERTVTSLFKSHCKN